MVHTGVQAQIGEGTGKLGICQNIACSTNASPLPDISVLLRDAVLHTAD
jgi:hypothetical protein